MSYVLAALFGESLPPSPGPASSSESSTSLQTGLLDHGRKIKEPSAFYATMLDIREILAFGVVATVLVLAMGRETWLTMGSGHAFQVLYSGALAAQFIIWGNEYCGHVKWLNSSGFTERRGLGKWACRLYGLSRSPRLSLRQFALMLIALVLSLITAMRWRQVLPMSFLLAGIVMSHLFWDRANIGGHGGLPVIHTLFCISLMADGNEAVVCRCVQAILAASYFGSGLCKLVTSLCLQRPRHWWGSGEGLKFYLLDSISIRPMRGIRRAVRAAVLEAGPSLKPLCDFAMNAALLFELSVPALAVFNARFAAISLFFFHYSIWFIFDIDFLSFWGPSLLAFAVQGVSSSFAPEAAMEEVISAWKAAPIRTAVLVSYTVIQVVVSLLVYDLNPRRGELLPFSAYPMFEEATRMFRESQAMALVLRVPTAVPIPEPYYIRMQALSTTPSQNFLSGPEVLSAVDARCLVVGIPRRAEQHPQPEDYVGGIWRPPPRPQPQGKLDACAQGIAAFCTTCVTDANGSLALNHERECKSEGSGSIILVGNVDCGPAMPELHALLNLLLSMAPSDAWRPERMRQLLAAYDDAENALARCLRVDKPFRKEIQLLEVDSSVDSPVMGA